MDYKYLKQESQDQKIQEMLEALEADHYANTVSIARLEAQRDHASDAEIKQSFEDQIADVKARMAELDVQHKVLSKKMT